MNKNIEKGWKEIKRPLTDLDCQKEMLNRATIPFEEFHEEEESELLIHGKHGKTIMRFWHQQLISVEPYID